MFGIPDWTVATWCSGVVTIVLMQTSTPALQRDFENAVFQAIVK